MKKRKTNGWIILTMWWARETKEIFTEKKVFNFIKRNKEKP